MKFQALALLFCSTLAVSSGQNIVEVASSLPEFSTLVSFVSQAGLVETLSGPGPFTVFAPTNEAFAKLPPAIVDAVSNDVNLLTRVLTYHVVPGEVRSNQLSNDLTAASVEGTDLRFNIYNVRARDSRGSGEQVITVNGKRVITPDVSASNGVIHVIDEVIFPFPEDTIAGIVSNDARFSTLLAAVSAADLVGPLSGDEPFTVFAPTNDAFAKIPQADLNALLADRAALTAVLQRHVVPGTLFARGISTGEVTTLGGEKIRTIGPRRVKRGTATRARVVEKDIIATNGVVHAINTVLLV